MIPIQNIVAWAAVAPWSDLRQIEQDLIISRALVEIFQHNKLSGELRFRGGTALNKLHFLVPLRYSEDIDLVRTGSGPVGPLLDGLRQALEPWLGRAKFETSPVAPKLLFQTQAESPGPPIRLKVEINTREIKAYDPPVNLPMIVNSPWFSGEALIATFSREEMLATKLRALLQRDKGRDLIDLSHALETFEGLNLNRTVSIFSTYLEQDRQSITRAVAEQRMFAKLAKPRFIQDLRPLISPEKADEIDAEFISHAFSRVLAEFIERMPGEPWAKTAEMKERFGLQH